MTTRSNGAHQGHFTRRTNAGTVRHYTPVLCEVTLRSGTILTGYLRTYEPERWDNLTLAVGLTRLDTQTVALADIRRVRKSEQQ